MRRAESRSGGRQRRTPHGSGTSGRRGAVLVLPVATALVAALSSPLHPAAAATGVNLVGTFHITDGACSAGATQAPTGSYFQMLAGKSFSGPFVSNGSAADASGPCANKTATPMLAGSDGGLKTGSFQPNPSPAFDSSGNALVGLIIKPVTWFGTKFSLSTQATDPQTGTAVPAPTIVDTGNALSGNVAAVDAAWNGSFFNMGAPKPDGSHLGETTMLSGSIDCQGAFTMSWASTVVGGAFNNFTGSWHLTGTFQPQTGTVADALGCSSSSSSTAAVTAPSADGGGGFPVLPVGIAVIVVLAIGGGVALKARAR